MKKLLIFVACVFFTHTTFGQVKLDSTDFERYIQNITGRFSTQLHQTFDSTKGDVMVRTIVFKRTPDVVWLYTQQGEWVDNVYFPYRQRVYAAELMDEYHIRLDIYSFKDDDDWWLVLDGPDAEMWLQNIPSDGLIKKEGCSLYIYKDNLNAFRGSTNETDCKGSFKGATYTTTEFVIYLHEVVSWERGWDDDGNQKWGPTNGPYIYSKVEQY